METTWLSPTDFVTGDPSLVISCEPSRDDCHLHNARGFQMDFHWLAASLKHQN